MALRDVNAVVTITTNAVKAIDDGKKLKQIYADINEQLNLMKSEGKVDTKEFKDMQKLAEDTKAKINEMLRGMELIDKVMGDISCHIGKDLNRALRETSKEFNKTSSSTDEGKAKLEKLRDVVSDLKRELSDRRGLTMSLKDAEAQLKNLDNASLDKLRQGLAAVREEAAKTTDPMRRREYSRYADQYAAEIAIKEHGGIAGAPATGSLKSEDRLHAEAMRQRLMQAYQTVSKSDDADHQRWAAEALKQIQQYNSALQALTETERKDLQLKREESARNEMLAKENEIIDRIKKGQKVTLEELIELQKHYKSELEKSQGLNITDPNDIAEVERLNKNLRITEDHIRKIRAEAGGEVMKNANYAASNLGSVSIDQLADISKKGKELFSVMKPGDKGYDQMKADLIAIDAELERVTPKWNELAQAEQALAKATDVANRAFADDKVMLNELTEAQKTLEAQIKKMSGLALDPADEMELEKAKRMLDDVNKALDTIALKDIDFNNLDATPTEKLEAALKNLEQQEKRLAGTQKAEAEEVANKKALIQKQLEKNKLAVMDVERAEQIAAKSGKYNVQELKQAYETLQQKLLTLNTNQRKDIARTKEDMAKLKQRIDEVTGAVKTQNTIWQTAVRNITAYVGVFGAFNFIKDKIMQVFESNKMLSDSLANIRKVSGLTGEEINTLYTNIAKIDTRNSVEQLNELAYAGAKLGVQEHGGVAALTGFVRAAEQVQMALGEDLGEDALPAMAKLTEVMGLMDQYGVEQAMQKAASAIFMLSTTSTSTGANIVEFSKRLMGLANVSHVTSAELVALGSASDSMGLMAEVSSTAFNKVFTNIQSNTAAIEKAVGVAKGSLKSLVDEGRTMEAIVTVFDKMRDMSMEEMQRRGIFTALGSDGSRLNNVMTTMADRVDMLKKHLDVANKAFEEGEAVIAEYMIQNQTAAAYIERASNAFEKAFTNPKGVDVVTDLAKQWHELAMEMTNSTVMMGSMKAALWAILEVVKGLLYVLPFLTQFLLFKGSLALLTQLCVGFWNMSKAIWACVTASKALTTAQKWNGIATGLSLLAATVLTLKAAFDQADEAAERARQKQQELDKSFAESKDVVDKSTKSLDEYKAALDKSNLSQDERDKRLRAYMKNEYQPYLDFLGLEIDKVENLADAYAQVTQAIKLKAAAEEKENYRAKVNGENRNNRIAAQAEVIREAKKAGFDIDKSFLDANWEEGSNALYNRITGGGSGAYVEKRKLQFPKFGELSRALKEYQKFKSEETRINRETDRMFNEEYKDLDLEHFSLEEFRKKQMEAQIQREKNRKNTVDMPPTKDELKAQRKAETEHKQAIRKELQDAKQESDAIIAKIEEWYRLQETVVTGFAADGKWTQQQAEMVNRELEAAKNEALANARLAISGRDTQTWEQTKESLRVMMFDTGQWSQELFQQMMDVSMASIRKNLSRIDKEGGQYGITTSSLKDGLDKNAAGNRRKVQELRNKTAKEVEKALLQYDYFEQAARAYEDRLTQLGLLTETAEQAADRIRKASGSLKAGNKTEEQMTADRSAARRQAGQQFIKNPGKSYAVDYTDTASLNSWLQDFSGAKGTIGASGMEFQFSGWAEAFKDQFNLWLKDSEKYKADIQGFYLSLVDFDTAYYDAVKQNYDKQKKQFDSRWNASGKGQAYEEMQSGLDRMGREQKMTGADQGTNFAQQAGFATLGTDPEIAASQLRMQQMQDELAMFIEVNEKKKLEGAAIEAFNQQVAERQRAVDEAQLAMAETVMSKINDRIAKLQEWTAPIEQFGADVGDAMGKAVFESENMVDGMKSALKNLAQAWGEHTIQIIKELMMQQLKQKMINKAMKKEQTTSEKSMTDVTEEGEMSRENLVESIGSNMVKATAQFGQQKLATKQQQDTQETTQTAHKTIFDVLAGIAGGSAQTIESLGWWGIPLVAVITALLMGLLNTALSALGGGGGNDQKAAAKPKIKLASGMLTYDNGNVQQTVGSQWRGKNGEYITDERRTVVGDDGRVYRAREQRSLPEGVSMVTEPIATRVNGQQALVGERGPEIVIGRRTTRAIQMNRPDLLRDLALIDRGITTRKVRTFDEGNISDMATAFAGQLPAPQQTADGQQGGGDAQRERDQAMLATLGVLSQTIGQLQQQLAAGIHAEMNMFGDNGAYKKFQQADKFYKRYGG